MDKDTTGCQLEVELMAEPTGMKLHIDYNSGKYSRSFIESFASTYENVLNQFMSREYIKDIEPADEKQLEILDSFNDTEVPYDDTQTIVSLFRRAASENADRTAVIFKDIKLTYRELDDITERIAGYIADKGLGRGDVVSILIPRDEYMPTASIGVLKSGCAYQPLDPTYPPERLNFMINDSGAKLLITTEELRPLITDYNGNVLILSEIASLPAANAELPEIKPEDLFILLYTSGSTGTPKGVRLTHGNLVCFVNWYHRYYNLQPEDCVGQYASYGFDACMMDMYSPLTIGASMCVIPEEMRLDLTAINEYLEKNHVTHQFMTTQVGRQFAVNIENKSLKHLSAGGEKLISLEPPKGCTLHNTYGSTEITVSSNIRELTHDDAVTVGRPLPNVKEFIVDSDGNELPFGVVGELYIGGIGVAIGYHNLPEMTAERFIDYRGTRVYKSGDYARWKDGGNVEILGRKDNQVKLRGLHIECGEVESAIAKAEVVKSAAVKINSIICIICACFTADRPMNIAAVRDEIGRTLTKYMVPTARLQLDKMPMTPNGKTDLRALPEAVIERSVSESAANDAERAFCKIFGEILQLEQVGATLGGTSLLVTRVMIEAERAGCRVTFQDVFSRPTPRMLAGLFIDEANAAAEPEHYDEIRNYDYTKLQAILDANTLESFKSGTRQPLGYTSHRRGGLSRHSHTPRICGKVYCLLRGKSGFTAEERLKGQLFYYFERPYDELLGKRLFIIDGDITKPIDKLPVSTVINCAAVVKHFSAGTDGTEIEDVNIGGVRNLIDYCLANNSRLIQVSTMSTVSMGMSNGEVFKEGRMIGERDLYFNQLLHSKFLAERLVLEAVADKGFGGTVFRRRVPD